MSLGQTEGGKGVMSECVCVHEGLFTCFTGQSSGCAGTTVCLWQTHAVFKHDQPKVSPCLFSSEQSTPGLVTGNRPASMLMLNII